ncbi:GntR family transcriptional regulator [Anoxybacterium hadale]|uniref:GntR family transcriptional regulator n=1 Tax=Anoxybacterium hadale TaxID=3408580 RepID=A0ACD1A7L3_9FIRM|nr:GntR family transcriptional regulator [Clostridiales bacterium]
MALSTDLFSSLRKDILQGRLRQGEKLTEQQVCDEYKVSRTPVREAFKQLELEGFIETIPNRGAFVTGFTPQDIRDMYELRKSYEILAVRWAIERITKDEYEKLEEAFEFMEFYTQKKDVEKMLNINMNFHDLIYKASHNRMLYRILSSFQLYIKQSRPARCESSDTYLDEVLQEHRAIFESFQNEDPDAAEAAVARHLDNAKQRAKSVLWQD